MIFIINTMNQENQELFYDIALSYRNRIVRGTDVQNELYRFKSKFNEKTIVLVDLDDKSSSESLLKALNLKRNFPMIDIIGISKMDFLKESALKHGISCVISKPTFKSLKSCISRYIDYGITSESKKSEINLEMPKNDLIYEIKEDLITLGCNPAKKSFIITSDTILFLVNFEKNNFKITKDVYPEIAIKHQCKTPVVKRCITVCIKEIQNNRRSHNFQIMFPYSNINTLTNSEFLTLMANKYKNF